MKVKELNALLNKLAKANPDADVSLGFSTLIGPQFDDPAIVQAPDGIYIIPQAVENSLEDGAGRDKVGEAVQQIHANWKADQGGDQPPQGC